MWDCKELDARKRIIQLAWSADVDAQEIDAMDAKLRPMVNRFQNQPFYLLVDISSLNQYVGGAKEKMVTHQQWLIQHGLSKAALVSKSAHSRTSLKFTAIKSRNDKEVYFDNHAEALAFLEKESGNAK